MPVFNVEALINDRVDAIRAYHDQAGIDRAELDLSGGIDSAVMAALLVRALGAKNVTLAHIRINTAPQQTQRAEALASALGCPLAVGNFSDIYKQIVDELVHSLCGAGYDAQEMQARVAADPTIYGSIRSCLRAPLGRGYNRLTGGGIRHGTGNECEDRFLRFYQKGGDGEVDTNPLAMLSKTEVYQLAYGIANEERIAHAQDVMYCGTPLYDAFKAIIDAVPSPDLWGAGDGHSDEAELLSWTGAPFTYGRINSATGEVISIGTIERVSRFLDRFYKLPDGGGGCFGAKLLFNEPQYRKSWDFILSCARASNAFPDSIVDDDVLTLLKAAQHVERVTRHKENPNIPTLGNRLKLVRASILTNDLTLELP